MTKSSSRSANCVKELLCTMGLSPPFPSAIMGGQDEDGQHLAAQEQAYFVSELASLRTLEPQQLSPGGTDRMVARATKKGPARSRPVAERTAQQPAKPLPPVA